MNIVVPMAGRGRRLAGHPSGLPKPLIEVGGRPLWRWATECLPLAAATRVIFVCLTEHDERYGLSRQIRRTFEHLPLEVVLLDDVTDGQLRTVVAAADLLMESEPILIYNADTWFRHDEEAFLDAAGRCDGLLGVARRAGDQWSFAKVDSAGLVVEVAEKRRISDLACTGLYYFRSTSRFLEDAETMFARGESVRGEYFVAPLYTEMIERGERIIVDPAIEFQPIGTEAELGEFETVIRDR